MNIKKGITLVALVVTIIIILIIVGVTIGIIMGPDGTIEKAKSSKLANRYAQAQDKIALRNTESAIAEEKNIIIEDENTFITRLRNEGILTDEDIYDKDEGTIKIGGIDKYTIPLNTNKKDMILIAETTSPNTKVELNFFNCLGLKVNWGDGNTTEITKNEYMPLKHTYINSSNYEVKIIGKSGTNSGINIYNFQKLKQWGENEFEGITCPSIHNSLSKQTEIPLPTEKSFKNLRICGNLFSNSNITTIPENLFENAPYLNDVSYLFAETNIGSIPEDLFKNTPQLERVSHLCYMCFNLTSIPSSLFNNCPNIIDFENTFYYCNNLTGNAPNWWSRTPTPYGYGCFGACNLLNNFYDIPLDWRKGPE